MTFPDSRARALTFGVAALLGLAAAGRLAAQDTTRADSTRGRAPIVMRGMTVIGTAADLGETRQALRRAPGSVALVPRAEIAATRQANLNDVLRMTPGVFVQPRFGAADESQLSVRGSGLRNNFHLRGINVLVNGMPYRNADGFSDFESLELLTTDNVQVWKGGNALRYGGSTLGGAINLETRTGYTADRLSAFAQGGAFGFLKAQLASGGSRGGFDWYGSFARTQLDGFRAWSDQRRDRLNLHAGWVLSPRVDLRTFYLFAKVREHLPGALTAAEFAADPRQAVANNVANRWGRDYDLHHVGAQLRTQLGETQRLEVAPYFQYRDIDHPIFEVISQVSRDGGLEARYENTAGLGGRRNRLTVGALAARGNVDNRRYVNTAGRHGALTKDQREDAASTALYAEDALGIAPRLTLVVAARWQHDRREATDHFLGDGDQSDRRTYHAVLPKLGLLYDLSPGGRTQAFANASRSWEPPLLLELNSLTVPGFIALRPQSAWQFELGTRGMSGAGALTWDVAVYDIELTDEITNLNVAPFPGATFTVPTYRNIERSRHYGLELGGSARLARGILARELGARDEVALHLAYTYARNTFRTDSLYAGHRIPGAPGHLVGAELRYTHPSGLSITPRLDWVPQAYPLDNAGTVDNPPWTSLSLRADWRLRSGFTLFAEGRNLTDERYSGSTQVNDGSGRYFEPSDGRALYAGLRWGS